MDTDEIYTASTPKKQKVEQEQHIVQVKKINMRGHVKKNNVKGKHKQ